MRLRGRPGWDGCQSALWDCCGKRICLHVKNSFPITVPQCLLKPSRPGLPRNLKEANWPIFSLSPVTVPEVFGKANSAQFPYRFFLSSQWPKNSSTTAGVRLIETFSELVHPHVKIKRKRIFHRITTTTAYKRIQASKVLSCTCQLFSVEIRTCLIPIIPLPLSSRETSLLPRRAGLVRDRRERTMEKEWCPPELSFGECSWLPVGDSAKDWGSYFTKEHLASQMEVYLVGAGFASPLSSVLSSRNKPAASLMRLNSIQKAWTSMKRSCKMKRTDNECNHHVRTS